MCAVQLSPSLEGVVFTVVSKRRGMCWTEKCLEEFYMLSCTPQVSGGHTCTGVSVWTQLLCQPRALLP